LVLSAFVIDVKRMSTTCGFLMGICDENSLLIEEKTTSFIADVGYLDNNPTLDNKTL